MRLLLILTLAFAPVFGTPFNVVTFNTGLTSRVSQYEDRRSAIGPAIQKLEADVVCLQEVWYSKDMIEILNHVNSTEFPYSYSYLHDDVSQVREVSKTEAPCASTRFVTSFLPCLKIHCKDPSDQVEFLRCAENCGMVKDLDQECVTCLILSDPKTAFQSCLYNLGNKFNVPGTLLLSRYPLVDQKLSYFVPHKELLIPRAYISAQIPDLGIDLVLCTHTTANLHMKYIEELDFGSWDAQNVAEARILADMLTAVPRGLIMGDMNGGPEVMSTEVAADFSNAYDVLLQSGLTPAYVDHLGICTWCVYNPLINYPVNKILDHVFIKNLTVHGAMRIFDRNIAGKEFPLSDHFGVKVVLED